MKIAYLFPGQGSQHAGMGRALAEGSAAARGIFDAVDEALGESLSELCFQGPEEDLRLTQNTQPALLAVSIAAWEALREAGPPPDPAFVAGHSLGEYSALVAAGSLEIGPAADLVRKRGLYMQKAVPVGEGAMAAVLGLDEEGCENLLSVAGGEVWLSADNAPGQAVIAGRTDAVDKAEEIARKLGAKKVVRLEVSAPFHTPLMKPARDLLAGNLAALEISDPRWPVVANVDAKPLSSGEEIREALVRQVTETVRWRQTLQHLREQGVETVVEIGAGRVLSGLARKVSRDWKILQVEDPEGVENALDALGS